MKTKFLLLVMIRYRLIEDQWDSLTNGWHYNSVEYSV